MYDNNSQKKLQVSNYRNMTIEIIEKRKKVPNIWYLQMLTGYFKKNFSPVKKLLLYSEKKILEVMW